MATGFNRLGASAYTSTTPLPIVQQAKKDWRFYQQAIIASEENTGKLLREYKEGGTWRQEYKSWEAACVPLNISRSQSNRLIAEDIKRSEDGASCAGVADKTDKKEQKALSQVEAARQEEPEKPRVKTAPEELAEQAEKNGHAEPAKPKTTENGKPKSQLGVWKKAEDLSGVWVRAVDDVQRACPNKIFHDRVLHHINEAIKLFQEWRQSVR